MLRPYATNARETVRTVSTSGVLFSWNAMRTRAILQFKNTDLSLLPMVYPACLEVMMRLRSGGTAFILSNKKGDIYANLVGINMPLTGRRAASSFTSVELPPQNSSDIRTGTIS